MEYEYKNSNKCNFIGRKYYNISYSRSTYIVLAYAQVNSNMNERLMGGISRQNPTAGSNMIIGYPGGPNITGSIPIVPTLSKATASQIHISLPNDTAIAEKSVGTNGHPVLARLGTVHGFLVYTITDTNSNFY